MEKKSFDILAKALHHHRSGNLDRAEQLYQDYLQNTPNDYEALDLLGILYAQQQRYSEAETCFVHALKLQPDSANCLNHLANVYKNQARMDDAITLFQRALKLEPQYAEAYANLATLYYQCHKYDLALTHYQQAIHYNEDYIDAHNNIASTYVKLDQLDKAKQHWQKVLTLSPHHTHAHFQLGNMALQNNHQEAIDHFFQVLMVDPQHFLAHFNLGVIFMAQEKWETAYYHFEQALKMDPDNIEAHYNLATTLMKLQLKPQALIHYKKCLSLDPNNPNVCYLVDALSGKQTSSRAPNEYIESLFDSYANKFDSELLDKLQYKVPELIYDCLFDYLSPQKNLTIIDLGCGTGLCGKFLQSSAKQLIGIDLSQKMLELAENKQCYDLLIHSDINKALQQWYNQIDIITAGDVLVYFGDLQEIISLVYQSLVKGGVFAFTVEANEKYSYTLQPTGRYTHSKNYVIQLAQKIGFSITTQQSVQLRLQQSQVVVGQLFLLKKI